eukprot:c46322_g1_i1 orf=146-325(+)
MSPCEELLPKGEFSMGKLTIEGLLKKLKYVGIGDGDMRRRDRYAPSYLQKTCEETIKLR